MLKTFIIRDDAVLQRMQAFLGNNWEAMARANKPIAVDVYEHKATRSNRQNRRYWALLREISENAWVAGKQFGSDSWHQWFAGKFIGWNDLPGGRLAPISTTTLKVDEFAEYITQVELYAIRELGVEFEQ